MWVKDSVNKKSKIDKYSYLYCIECLKCIIFEFKIWGRNNNIFKRKK